MFERDCVASEEMRRAFDQSVDVLHGLGANTAVWQGLLDRGVLVREVGPPGWLRVSIGTPAEMAAFRDALTEVLGNHTAAGGGD